MMVSIRMIAPPKPQQPVQEQTVQTPPPVTQEKVVRKAVAKMVPQDQAPREQTLNQIEPAAAPSNIDVSNPSPAPVQTLVPSQIPVVNEVNLKGSRVPPEYPRRALRLRQEGVVRLQVLVSESGAQQDIKIVSPSGFSALDEAALKAVRQWRFEPTNIGGKPVISWVEIPVEFKIN